MKGSTNITSQGFTFREIKIMAYADHKPTNSLKLRNQIANPTALTFYGGTLEAANTHPICGPGIKVLISFIGGKGCRSYLGIAPFNQYYIINDMCYRRITYNNLGIQAQSGLKDVINGRLVHYLEQVYPRHYPEVLDAVHKTIHSWV